MSKKTFKLSEISNFLDGKLVGSGSLKISEISSDSSLLNYQNGSRFASIQIFEKTLFGSKVLVSVTEVEWHLINI